MEANNITDIIKTMRRDRRNEEISTYGKSISTPVIYKNKKKYNRKNKHDTSFE
jgi:hypothetical protein